MSHLDIFAYHAELFYQSYTVKKLKYETYELLDFAYFNCINYVTLVKPAQYTCITS